MSFLCAQTFAHAPTFRSARKYISTSLNEHGYMVLLSAHNPHQKSQKFNSQFWVLVISKFPLKEWLHSSAASRFGFTAPLHALLWSHTSRHGSLPFKVSLPPRKPQPCVLITTCACGSRITQSYVTHCRGTSSVSAKRFVIQQRAKSSLWFLY